MASVAGGSPSTSQWPSIAVIAAHVASGELRAVDLVEQSLRTIDALSEYQAIIATIPERARQRAAEIDAAASAHRSNSSQPAPGRLAGVPFIAKDNYLVFGADTTAASNMLRGFEAPYQPSVIERLEAEGAICVAKANLDAFAHGGSTENSDFFTTKNPHDETRVPGGSSGGSAAAVVLDMAPFSLGTDTGGSIRQPASFVGCVGFKPTYGLTSRSGVVAMASSTDVMGPLARSVADAALVFDVIAGQDVLDSTTIERDPAGYALSSEMEASDTEEISGTIDLTGTTIGVIAEWMTDDLDADVRSCIEATIARLQAAGATIKQISLPSLPLALAVYYIVVPAEISSNLSRYDGQRFAHHSADAKDLEASYSDARGSGFGKEAKRRVMIGTYVLSSGYYDAYYKKAQTVRTKLINEFNDAFAQVDFLLGPTAPTTAFKIGTHTSDPLQMYLADVMTVGPSLVGIPAIVVPAGLTASSDAANAGLPVGVQLMAPQRADRALLEFAQFVEQLNIEAERAATQPQSVSEASA